MGQNPTTEELSSIKRKLSSEIPFAQTTVDSDGVIARIRAHRRDRLDAAVEKLDLEVVDEGVVIADRVVDELKLR